MADSSSETPVYDLLDRMTSDSITASSLDAKALMLVRIAALVAVDASALSYQLNLEAADAVGLEAHQIGGVLAAIAPIVGTARVVAATTKIVEALEIELEAAPVQR